MGQTKSCENCKHSDWYYIFDDEIGEEYPIYTCKKGHNKLLNFDYVADKRESLTQQEECTDFKKYKPKSYIEVDTECDKCDKLDICKKYGLVLNSTTSKDIREHYIVGIRGCYASKE